MSISIPVARFRLRFSSDQAINSSFYRGSAWRGALGHALRQTACVTRERKCSRCLVHRSCVYPYVFETPAPDDSSLLLKGREAPHPFALELELRPRAGRREEWLGLTLFGAGVRQLPYLVHALSMAGEKGLGAQRLRLQLEEVQQENTPSQSGWTTIYVRGGELTVGEACGVDGGGPPESVRITFLTPLRLRREHDHITPGEFSFQDLILNLTRRAALVAAYHGEASGPDNHRELIERAKDVPILNSDLRWFDWKRKSSRQQREIAMGGIVGWLEYEAGKWPEFWPWVRLGEYLHVGKGTSMGLGWYTTQTEADDKLVRLDSPRGERRG